MPTRILQCHLPDTVVFITTPAHAPLLEPTVVMGRATGKKPADRVQEIVEPVHRSQIHLHRLARVHLPILLHRLLHRLVRAPLAIHLHKQAQALHQTHLLRQEQLPQHKHPPRLPHKPQLLPILLPRPPRKLLQPQLHSLPHKLPRPHRQRQ